MSFRSTHKPLSIDVLAAVGPPPLGIKKEILRLSQTDIDNRFIDLEFEAQQFSVELFVSGVNQFETQSYTVNYQGGVSGRTRIRFVYDLLDKLIAGDTVVFQYFSASTPPIEGDNMMYYGDASDGDVVLDGVNTYAWALKVGSVYTLLRSVYAHDLTVSAGSTLIPAMFSIYATGLLSNAGLIAADGGAGGNGGAAGATGAPGAAPIAEAAGFLATHEWGGPASIPASAGGGEDGGAGNVGAGDPGVDANPLSNSLIVSQNSGDGGAGGLGSSGAGGIAGKGVNLATGVAPFSNTYIRRVIFPTITVNPFGQNPGGGQPGGSGGGGAGDGVNPGGGGGGSGGGGGVVAIYASILSNTGTIRANGGKGGDGGTPIVGNTGGGGGGGGAIGGVVMILNQTVAAAGLIQVNGGNGGDKGLKHGTGVDGAIGQPGDGGIKIHYEVASNTYL